MRKSNQKGFTIIELLVVIVIIGILVALALPNLFSAQARGRDTDRKNELKNLQSKLETHFGDNDNYPLTLAGLDPAPTTDESTDPKGVSYTYTPLPAGCDNTATFCDQFTLSITLENDNDKDATAGVYTLQSVNQ